jgi:glycosyltransferase involved in cell wall biosynthesis
MAPRLLSRLAGRGLDLLEAVRPAPSRPRGGPSVLIIDNRFPDPARDSGSLDALNYIAWFRRLGWRVRFLSLGEHGARPRLRRHAARAGAEVVTPAHAPDIEAYLRREAARHDLLFLTRITHGGRLSGLLRRVAPEARQIFNTVDLHHLREGREAELTGAPEARTYAESLRQAELALAEAADATIVVSEHEAELLRAACPGARIWLMPLYRPVPARIPGFAARSGIGFVADFAHKPNVDALRYFLEAVWPDVHRRAPAIRFDLVGNALPERIGRALPGGVRYLGRVGNLEAWLAGLRLTVAPLRFGAGAKGKVASSLCNGVPVVGTSVALEGMWHPGEGVRVADDPARMAAEIVRLNDDRHAWERASAAAHAFAQKRLSPEAGLNRFATYLSGIDRVDRRR